MPLPCSFLKSCWAFFSIDRGEKEYVVTIIIINITIIHCSKNFTAAEVCFNIRLPTSA